MHEGLLEHVLLQLNAFLPRGAMLARYMLSSCVCLSVRLRLSHASIVP